MIDYIKSSDLYLEVLNKAKQKGYSLNLFSYSESSKEKLDKYGFQKIDFKERKIEIGIDKLVEHDKGAYFHELLHAKLFLEDYPQILAYPKIALGETIDYYLSEIGNISQHALIYPIMSELECSHSELDERYLKQVLENTNLTYKGHGKFFRALELLEGSLRNKNKIEEFKDEILKKQPEEYKLFEKIEKIILAIKNPLTMRNAIIKLIDILEEYLKLSLEKDFFLKYFARVPLISDKLILEEKADKFFYMGYFNEFADIFIMSKIDNHCCGFIDESRISKSDIQNMLNNYTVKQFKERLNI